MTLIIKYCPHRFLSLVWMSSLLLSFQMLEYRFKISSVLWGRNKKRFFCSQVYWQCSSLPRPLIDIVTWYIIPFLIWMQEVGCSFLLPSFYKVTSRQNSLDKIRYKAQRTCCIHFSFSCCKLCPGVYHAILGTVLSSLHSWMKEVWKKYVTWEMVRKSYSWDTWYGSKDKTSPSS